MIWAKCSERIGAKHVLNVPNVPHVPKVPNTNIVPGQQRTLSCYDLASSIEPMHRFSFSSFARVLVAAAANARVLWLHLEGLLLTRAAKIVSLRDAN